MNDESKEQALAGQIKKQISGQLKAAMKRGKVSQAELARRMRTSRAVVHRLVQRPTDTSVTLVTIARASVALGRTMRFKLNTAA